MKFIIIKGEIELRMNLQSNNFYYTNATIRISYNLLKD